MLLLIDNYDSFTYNLVHFLGDLGARCAVHRNDQITVDEAMALKPAGIVLSPGPCTPNEAGICMDLVRAAAHARQAFRHPAQGPERVRGCPFALPGDSLSFADRRPRGLSGRARSHR